MLRNLLVVLSLLYCAHSQDNAGTNVAPALQECYNTTRYATRDYRLPSSISVLIELIRKVEDGNPNLDSRQIAIALLHRYRQDGIRKTGKNVDGDLQVLPYSPRGVEAYKNRIQLTKITSGNAVNFNNESLSHLQACSLHYMVSSTIEVQTRNDEDSVCGRTERYTSRIKRQAEFTETSGKSRCPIEGGVINTKWGAVKAGLLISGIAAGFQPNPINSDDVTVESSYASTIAGELSETAIHEPSTTKIVGNPGGWNSTVEPKYYFLSQNDANRLYLTDAEIRGGLDGLFLGLNIGSWKSKSSNIKVSQILDLYYSRGVFNASSRACNRKDLTRDLVSSSKLVDQTVGFSKILDDVSQLTYTINPENLPTMVQSVVDSLKTYMSSNLQDLACSANPDLIERVSTDVLIFIDSGWDYNVIQPLVSYILEGIDVNKYESSYTIFNGANGNTIVNKSRSIIDFHEFYNLTQQQLYPTGFDYAKVIQAAEALFTDKLNNDTDLTGQSTVVLMLPHRVPTETESNYVQSRRDYYKSYLPDLRVLVGGTGSSTPYYNLVNNPTSDIITVSDDTASTQIKTAGQAIVDKFKKIPRSVVNPACKSNFQKSDASNFEVIQYVEPEGINYHKISPNYFYDGQTLKIKGYGYGSLTVCISRSDANPDQNNKNCQNINSDEFSTDISNYCTDEIVTICSPVYISVQGQSTGTVRCTENTCRFPDNIKYSINLENVQCSNGNQHIIALSLIMALLVALLKL